MPVRLALIAGLFAATSVPFAAPVEASAAATPVDAPAPGGVFTDCASGCPDMVVVPAGSYSRGGPMDYSELPPLFQRPAEVVTIPRPFAIGRYDVTVGQYAQFAAETGRAEAPCSGERGNDDPATTWRHPGFAQTDDHPVVCVNLEDARAYAAWLSRRTGHAYRLPTEDESQFAQRANSTTTYYWGDGDGDEVCAHANTLDGAHATAGWGPPANRCNDGYAYTSPVGHYPPNAFGLYDMSGNVDQLTSTCDDSRCWLRVARGGSWSRHFAYLATAGGVLVSPWQRTFSRGFRVVRDL